MAVTRLPTDQSIFRSSLTGDHNLDSYLESAELGGRTLASLLADLFTGAGAINPGLVDMREDPFNPGDLQLQLAGGPWVTIMTVPLGPPGPPGPSGAGTGDLLAAQELNEIFLLGAPSQANARANIGCGALAALSTVSPAELQNSAVTLPKLANGTPNRVVGFDAGGAPIEYSAGANISLAGGSIAVTSAALVITDHLFVPPAYPAAGTGAAVILPLTVDPVAAKNCTVTFDGLAQQDGFTVQSGPNQLTLTAGLPALISQIRIRVTN